VPLWFRCGGYGPDWIRGTLRTWYLSSIAAVVLPFLVALGQGWQEFTSMSFIQRMVSAPPHYPSLVTCSLVDVVVAISGKGDLKYLRGKWGQCEMRLHVWRMFFEGD